ncbi:MAG: putative sulfate exporter family transporter [Candidatus Kapabacteria bacterium]|nr:putative sulfate exporter family transporter [Candidatus Kapabacteria bacterium]
MNTSAKMTHAESVAIPRLLVHSSTISKGLFWLGVAIVLSSVWLPIISPPVALALGILFAFTVEHPHRQASSRTIKWLLQASVVGLGFGINAYSIVKAGQTGVGFTIAGIAGTLSLGLLLGKFLGVRGHSSYLISVGTAICGGSAIAAVAPVLKADETEISVALGTVFVLNALALFLFPPLGTALGLTQEQFGVWAAIAIHDTSSVVGAAAKFGSEALATATTVKLSRALWIIPVTLATALWIRNSAAAALSNESSSEAPASASSTKIAIPYFVLFFILASVITTFLPGASVLGGYIVPLAKAGLTLTLFLIGTGLSKTMLLTVGIKPLLQGIVLWVAVSALALWSVISFL